MKIHFFIVLAFDFLSGCGRCSETLLILMYAHRSGLISVAASISIPRTWEKLL